MNRLNDLDLHLLREAEGWLMLGNAREAHDALDRLSQSGRGHPEALQLRWHIGAFEKRWDLCAEIGRTMCETQPASVQAWINYANALFYLKRFQEAIDVTVPVLDRFPKNPYLRYNLACYECQKGRSEEAIEWFRKALKLASRIKMIKMALADPDLAPLWERIARI